MTFLNSSLAILFLLLISYPLHIVAFSGFHVARFRGPSLFPLKASEKDEALSRIEDSKEVGRKESYSVTVMHEGKSCNIDVYQGETILAALERQHQHVTSNLNLSSEMPFDCRRGNCMTCAASRVRTPDDELILQDPLVPGEDGLSPYVSRKVAKAGYLLTCRSTVQSDGLTIELGQNDKVWQEMYRLRLESDPQTQQAARDSMARVIRKYDEQHVPRWVKETEEILQKTPNEI